MTLVYREQKKTLFQGSPSLGPGHYNPTPLPSTVSAQFSRSNRGVKEPLTTLPGPGHYRSLNTLQYRAIVGAVGDVGCFKSRIPRFDCARPAGRSELSREDEKRFQDITQTSENDCEKKGRDKRRRAGGENGNGRRCHHAPARSLPATSLMKIPSIPYKKESYGYQTKQDDSLMLNKNPWQVYAGTTQQSVGPGQYNLPHQPNRKGCGWSKSKAKRQLFPQDFSSTFLTHHQQHSPTAPATPGGFISKLPKFKTEGQMKFLLLKNQNKKLFKNYYYAGEERLLSELDRQLHDGRSIGPGAYTPYHRKTDEVPESKQCFISKQPRFATQANTDNRDYPPTAQITQPHQQPSQPGVPPTLYSPSLSQPPAPGPGSYPQPAPPSKFQFSFPRQKRFAQPSPQPSPGPTDYSTVDSWLDNSISHLFDKSTGRNQKVTNQVVQQPTNHKKNTSSSSSILKEKENFVPFNSAIQRHCIYPVEKPFDWQDNENTLKRKTESGHLYRMFRRKIQRRSDEKVDRPGPGHYQVAKELVKSTFNITADKRG